MIPDNPRIDSLALVVFAGQADLKGLRLLRPGFRHCFVVLRRQGHWVVYNPLSHWTEIQVLADRPAADLACWFAEKGYRVVPAPAGEAPRIPAPWRPYTCVEAVKRALGLRAPWVFTPWQLYKRLCGR
ncbi:MAG: hypothetical protein H7841_06530 [Magnetospirillum sp. WYHS-4]